MTMEAKGRRSFTDEFKREAVSLLARSGRPLTQVARELGIQPSMLRGWHSTHLIRPSHTRHARDYDREVRLSSH
jgi:transposase-like protein